MSAPPGGRHVDKELGRIPVTKSTGQLFDGIGARRYLRRQPLQALLGQCRLRVASGFGWSVRAGAFCPVGPSLTL